MRCHGLRFHLDIDDEIRQNAAYEGELLVLEGTLMPIVSAFFGIIIRMYFDEHNPPHCHAEYHGNKAVFDFRGNIVKGDLRSPTATKLVREWVDAHARELLEDWALAREGKELRKIAPLS